MTIEQARQEADEARAAVHDAEQHYHRALGTATASKLVVAITTSMLAEQAYSHAVRRLRSY